MGGSSSQTIGQRYFAKLTTFIGNPIDKLIGINFDNRGWIFKPENDQNFLRVENPNLYGDKEGGVAGYIDVHTGTADQLPNTTYSADFPKVSGYPFQSYLLFRGLGKKLASSGGLSQFTQGSPKHYNNSFYHGNSGYMKEMLLWPQRVHVRNDGRSQWYGEKAAINIVSDGQFNLKKLYVAVDFSTELSQIEFENAKQSMSELISNLRSRILLRQNLDVYFFFMGSSQDFVGDIFHFQQLNENHLIVAENYINAAQQHTGFSEGTTTYYKNFFNGEWDEGIFIIVAKNFYKDDPIAAQEFKQGNSDLFSRVKCKTVQIGVVVDNNLEVVDSYGPSFAISSNIVVKAAALELTDKAPYYFDYADLNPIHKIREILTDDTAMNKPESEVNDTNFRKAADLIYTENLGISWSVTEKSCLEAINELCGHIEAGLRMNRQTGLYEN